MSSKSRVVTSTASPVNVTRPVVTVSCPSPATTLPTTTTVPTATAGVTDQLFKGLGSLGGFGQNAPQQVFKNPAVDLAPFNKLASLAAFNPTAALAAKSPTLAIFNPAINPAAAFLQFNPGAAPTLALQGKGKPFGKFGI